MDKVENVATLMERILYEVKKVVVGQDHFLERVLVATLAQGHLLVEGVPGLAKTLTVKTLAQTIRGTFRRIQFTPDLVPADLVSMGAPADGLITSFHYSAAHDSPENKAFVEEFEKVNDGMRPNMVAVGA
jgi:predicted ATPase with chaperone activity